MSGDEYYFSDSSDYDFWDDSPTDSLTAVADELAESTTPDPVWDALHPSFDTEEYWSDWDYYHDAFFDADAASPRSPAATATAAAAPPPPAQPKLRRERPRKRPVVVGEAPKRRKGEAEGAVVRWRTKEMGESVQVLVEGGEEQVAFLKDWKVLFVEVGGEDAGSCSGAVGGARKRKRDAASVPAVDDEGLDAYDAGDEDEAGRRKLVRPSASASASAGSAGSVGSTVSAAGPAGTAAG
ncbi:MAG: hypothetical protein M1829_003382 [Trizodia sp. TS-e1964]|nr:MAG: hypothetical protein M1829_003382 [Trizodia sp. TS-e1964]